MKTAALIVAAGRGSRASREDGLPKQYVTLGGVPILTRTIAALLLTSDEIQVVIHPDDILRYDEIVRCLQKLLHPSAFAKILPPVSGGAQRQDSVRLGLEALAARPSPPDRVMIHDAARPFVSARELNDVLASLDSHTGAILALPVSDTLKRAGDNATIAATVPRSGLWRALTPQAFRFGPILKAHRDAHAGGVAELTDDAAVAEWAGLDVALVRGSSRNTKITTAEDFVLAEETLQEPIETGGAMMIETRTGQGFDIHRFADGDHVWLGGVKIAHTQKLDGHSDADVALHALTDALLGTIGDGDIGQHFPPSDPKWKGAASKLFLADAARRVKERGGRINNVDVTILAEAPKVGPHRAAMQQVIGETLGLSADRIGIKATTMEGLGAIGRRDGIAAMAIATVQFPSGTG